jgi:hypothetical protein
MMWALVAVGVWLLAVGFFCALARSAGRADAGLMDFSMLELAGEREQFDAWVGGGPARLLDRREGPADRRSESRPWGEGAPGRRREDALRRAEEAERRLRRSRERLERRDADSA